MCTNCQPDGCEWGGKKQWGARKVLGYDMSTSESKHCESRSASVVGRDVRALKPKQSKLEAVGLNTNPMKSKVEYIDGNNIRVIEFGLYLWGSCTLQVCGEELCRSILNLH